MPPKQTRITAKEAEKLLLNNGFKIDRQKGSHRIYIKNNFRMVIPHHSNKILHPKIIKQLLEIIEQSLLN
jgi:predicted RNA binding protein YcfA (HicA-like mRNA interferase family)